MVYDLEMLSAEPQTSPTLLPTATSPSLHSEKNKKQKNQVWTMIRLQCVTSLFLVLIMLFIHLYWPRANHIITDLLVAEEIGPVELAAQVLVREVFCGKPLPDALANFCTELVNALP